MVPSLLAFLATHPLVKKEHLQSVDTIMVGAAPTTDSIFEKFLLKCDKTKEEIRLLQGERFGGRSPILGLKVRSEKRKKTIFIANANLLRSKRGHLATSI